jgi:hypothetical protein
MMTQKFVQYEAIHVRRCNKPVSLGPYSYDCNAPAGFPCFAAAARLAALAGCN